MNKYIISFRVVKDNWYNRFFPFTLWQGTHKTKEHQIDLIKKIQDAINDAFEEKSE